MICGVDEAGRGPVIGPLVVAAIMVEDDKPLREIGVKDSKLLSPTHREKMFEQILTISEVETSVISSEEIDARGKTSLNELEVQHFATVIGRLSPRKVFVDAADVVAERFGENICSLLNYKPDIICQHRADMAYPIVSAASIVAKVIRDKAIRNIGDELGENIGSGYPTDPITRTFIERWIHEHGDLPPHTRRSWATSQKMISTCKIQKLDNWMEIP